MTPIEQLQSEIADVDSALSAGNDLQTEIANSWMLAMLRDKMVDARDKTMVSAFLSLRLSLARKMSELTDPMIGRTLRRITRPGIAVDVAKLRDAVETVAKELAKCTPPPQGAARK